MDEKELLRIDNSIFLDILLELDRSYFFPKAKERKENVQCTFLVNRRAGVLAFSCHPFQELDRSHFVPKAMERKENVQCTFLVNRRAGVLAFSCHPFRELDRSHLVPKDDN